MLCVDMRRCVLRMVDHGWCGKEVVKIMYKLFCSQRDCARLWYVFKCV